MIASRYDAARLRARARPGDDRLDGARRRPRRRRAPARLPRSPAALSTAGICDRLRAEGHAAMVRARTGLVLDAYFSGTKIAWILDQAPDARRRAARGQLAFGTVDTWLLWKLTRGRVHATDVSNASRTLCLNLATVDWDDRMCALLDVPPEVLPTLVDSSGPCAEPADLGWLPRRVPIAGIAGDQQAALFGHA